MSLVNCGLPGCQGPKMCERPGCEGMHPNGCSADPALAGWRCCDPKRPRNRAEAVREISRTGFTVPAMLAVAECFPLPGEPEETNAWLTRLRESDPRWHESLIRERDEYVRAWR